MITREDTPPAILELLEATPPAPAQIALHVTVDGKQGRRDYWMSEGGTLFFNRVDGTLSRATEAQTRLIMRGLELARRSPAFEVHGRTVPASELDFARGLSAS